jgi:hypothetical protein
VDGDSFTPPRSDEIFANVPSKSKAYRIDRVASALRSFSASFSDTGVMLDLSQ